MCVESQYNAEFHIAIRIDRSSKMDKPLPYIAAAFLCERVLQEKDEVISVTRIVDRLHYQIHEGAPPGTKPVLNLQGLIMIKSGPVSGEHTLKIFAETPSGKRKEVHQLPVTLRGKDQGQNVIMNLGIGVEEDGLHWFDVLFDDDLLTRIPITVMPLPKQAAQGKPN